MSAKRCFVISPIGAAGSEVREHADDVFHYIIKPAMEEVGLGVYRADHDPQAGRITDHMFDSILKDDLCIAVLSFQNPNVYYELAVAQSAARPVIILNLKGNPLPFDIKDLRVIEYDFRPKAIIEKVYVRQIVEMVQNLAARNWTVPVPFGTGLSPLGRTRGDFVYHGRVDDHGRTDEWMEWLAGARHHLDLSGINLRYWSGMPGFRKLIERVARDGCAVRFLLMHPDNPALAQYFNPQISLGGPRAGPSTTEAIAYFRDLTACHPNVRVRQMRTGTHHQQVVRIDERLYAALVMYSETTRRCPLIECSAPSTFFQMMVGEFDALWDANAEPAGPAEPDAPRPPNGPL
jgi:hypothetical protein